jgi:hypothetical protein
MGDSTETPTIPTLSLPQGRRSRMWVIENSDLTEERDVSDLIARLYDYPEDDFYLFRRNDHSTSPHLENAIAGEVISTPEWKLNYYPHPKFERDYVYLDKDRLFWDWEKDLLATSPMFIRLEIKLTAKARRAFEHQQLIASLKHADRNPIELKPNFMGLGIDVYKALDWLRTAFQRESK